MATSPKSVEASDPLDPMLREAEAELHRRLHEACDAESSDMRTESSEEIRRIEDSLLQAVVAAEQTIMLRKQRQKRDEAKARKQAQSEQADAPLETRLESQPAADADGAVAAGTAVREFCDAAGQQWRAWSVIPGLARPNAFATKYLGDYHKGWLCFESLQGAARRRLPAYPQDWTTLDEGELEALLEQAITAPDRKSGTVAAKLSVAGDARPAAGA